MSSAARDVIRKLNRHSTLASQQERVLAAKEKQKAKAAKRAQRLEEFHKMELLGSG